MSRLIHQGPTVIRVVLCVMAMLGVVTVFSVGGCGGSGGTASGQSYDHIYVVRARVTQLPDGSPGGQFMAHHETIPDYISTNGSVGMQHMIMPFTVVDDAVLGGIVVGDIVEITFGETHRPRVSQGVIAIRRLPADTVLDLGEGQP